MIHSATMSFDCEKQCCDTNYAYIMCMFWFVSKDVLNKSGLWREGDEYCSLQDVWARSFQWSVRRGSKEKWP